MLMVQFTESPSASEKSKILDRPTDHLRWVAGSPVTIVGGPLVKMSSAEHWSELNVYVVPISAYLFSNFTGRLL